MIVGCPLVQDLRDTAFHEITAAFSSLGRGHSGGGEDPEVQAKAFGQLVGHPEMSAKEMEEYKQAFDKYLRKQVQEKALQVGSDPDGGFWVSPDVTGRVVQYVYEMSPMRRLASVQTIGTDALEGPYDLDQADSGWVGETEDRTETGTPQVGWWRIPVHEQYAMPKISQKMLDDAQMDMGQWLENKIRRKFTRKENEAFVNGDGNMKPRGFVTYPEGTPTASNFEQIKVINTGNDGDFPSSNPGDKLIDVVYDLEDEYVANASWVMRRALESEIRQFKDSNGNYIWVPDFAQRNGRNLLGHNIVTFPDMPAKASNSKSIAFGDFEEAYQIVDRRGIRVMRDPYTAKPWVKFYSTRRVGGGVVNFQALRILKFAA